jgi:hypothetical protein
MSGPQRRCRNCEYFDGGGLDVAGEPRAFNGDCLNPNSNRFQTTADDGADCAVFHPDTGRWPIPMPQGRLD